MIRFVVGPDDSIVPDIAEKLPGRGIWVSADAAAMQKVMAKNLLPKAAKRQVRVDPELPLQVESLLRQRLIELISLGRKAGLALCGFEKVRASLEDGSAALLIQAADGSEREKARLRPPGDDETRLECLNSRELGLAFGRDSVIHAALKAGGITDRIKYEAARYMGLLRH